VQKVTVLQSDPHNQQVLYKLYFLTLLQSIKCIFESQHVKQKTHVTAKLKITDAIHACNYYAGKQHLLKNFTYCLLWQEDGFMKETNLSWSGLQSCCTLETKDTGLHVTIMTIQYGHFFFFSTGFKSRKRSYNRCLWKE